MGWREVGADRGAGSYLYIGVTIEQNMDYAARMLTEPLSVEPFLANVHNVAIAGIVQMAWFAVILILSVWKPWVNRKKHI